MNHPDTKGAVDVSRSGHSTLFYAEPFFPHAPMSADRLTVKDPASWDRITAAARAHVSAELFRLEQTPLELGQPIAWAITAKLGGVTDDLSVVHHVGATIGNVPHTTCGEAIPAPARWLALSPAFAKSLTACPYCKAEMQRSAWGTAA